MTATEYSLYKQKWNKFNEIWSHNQRFPRDPYRFISYDEKAEYQISFLEHLTMYPSLSTIFSRE